MLSILSIIRFIIPAIALIILLVCIGSLFVNRPRVHKIASLVDEEDGTIIDITHWETSLGKSKANDIVLAGDGVDKFHAVIANKGNEWLITNTTLKNFVVVNGKILKGASKKKESSSYIANGDVIQIGSRLLKFVCDEAVNREQREQFKELATQNEGAGAGVGPVYATLVNLKTKRPTYLCSEDVMIGRSSDCDIVVPSQTISSHHARIQKIKNSWVLTDNDSHNGTKLNGRYISVPVNIFDADMITIGDEIFIFYER